MSKPESRRALRLQTNLPTRLYAIGQPDVSLHPSLAKVYERVAASRERIGERLPGIIKDLSTNGAYLATEPLPLLSRVAFSFELDGYGQVEALGWVLWRRTADCEVPRDDGSAIQLPSGFGVLFEAIPLDARLAIHRLVGQAGRVSA